jgi:Ni/Fe-hydrogenase subunit HybB-like protein
MVWYVASSVIAFYWFSDLSLPVVLIVAVVMGIAMVLTGRWMFRRQTL